MIMKKVVIYFNIVIYIFSFLVSAVTLLTSDFKIETALIFTLSLLFLIPFYLIAKQQFLKNSLLIVALINLLQAFSFIVLGLTFKLIIGPDLSLYFINSEDNLVKFSFKFFNLYSYFNYIENGNTLAVGVNFFHLIFCLYFYHEAKEIKK